MNLPRINRDIYKASGSLKGAERFKLELKLMNHQFQSGRNKETLPTDNIFTDRTDWEEYRAIKLEFIIVNFVLFPRLSEIHALMCGAFLAFSSTERESDDAKEGIRASLKRINEYFQLLAVIEQNINAKHEIDLFIPPHREQLNSHREIMLMCNEAFSIYLGLSPENKISDFTDQELNDTKEFVFLIMGNMHDLADLPHNYELSKSTN